MKKWIKGVFTLSFIGYLAILIYILFLGLRGNHVDLSIVEYIKYSSNIVPFETIGIYVQEIRNGILPLEIPIKNLFGNFMLFLPMGLYVPFFIKELNNLWMFSVTMAILLFIIEITQLVTKRGSLDIDDFILNFPGALVGFMIWRTKIAQEIVK